MINVFLLNWNWKATELDFNLLFNNNSIIIVSIGEQQENKNKK